MGCYFEYRCDLRQYDGSIAILTRNDRNFLGIAPVTLFAEIERIILRLYIAERENAVVSRNDRCAARYDVYPHAGERLVVDIVSDGSADTAERGYYVFVTPCYQKR